MEETAWFYYVKNMVQKELIDTLLDGVDFEKWQHIEFDEYEEDEESTPPVTS